MVSKVTFLKPYPDNVLVESKAEFSNIDLIFGGQLSA